MCLKYFFEKIANTNEETKYVQLQEVICEPVMFNINKIAIVKKQERKIYKQNYRNIILAKDRLIFGEIDNIKYDYIIDFKQISDDSVVINVFADFDENLQKLFIEDSISSILIKFYVSYDSEKFIKELMDYLLNYKKYNSWDKRIKEFKMFKKFFK